MSPLPTMQQSFYKLLNFTNFFAIFATSNILTNKFNYNRIAVAYQ